MKTSTISVLAMLGWSVANAAPNQTSGLARCADSTENAATACYVDWSWTSEAKAYQWIQVFDPPRSAWHTIAELPTAKAGRSAQPVPDGNIYRVHSCDEADASTGCVDTTVFWAPYLPREDAIPKLAVDSHGKIWRAPKNLPYYSQLMSLNAFRLREWFYDVSDKSKLSQMSPPIRPFGAEGWKPWENISESIFEFYQQARLPQPEQGPMPAPEYIGDVPEDQYAQYRARLIRSVPDTELIVYEPTNIKHSVTVFVDIRCVHCHRIVMNDMDELMRMGIRIRLVAFPLGGETSEEARTMNAIWCASDRKDAFRRAALGQTIGSNCPSDTVTNQYALARRLGLTISPSIVAENGEVLGGYLSPADLQRRLEEPPPMALRN